MAKKINQQQQLTVRLNKTDDNDDIQNKKGMKMAIFNTRQHAFNLAADTWGDVRLAA